MFKAALTLTLVLAASLPAAAQGGRTPPPPGNDKKDEKDKKERLTVTLIDWVEKAEGLEELIKDALAKLPIVQNVQVNVEEHRTQVSFSGSGPKDALEVEKALLKAKVPAALFDPGMFLFKFSGGKATPDEIRTLLKQTTGGVVETPPDGRIISWAASPGVSLAQVHDACEKVKIKLECLSHAEFRIELSSSSSQDPDPAPFQAKLKRLKGVLRVEKEGKTLVALVVKPLTPFAAIEKLAKSMDLAAKELKEEAKR